MCAIVFDSAVTNVPEVVNLSRLQSSRSELLLLGYLDGRSS